MFRLNFHLILCHLYSWRPNACHILMYMSDAGCHYVRDGKVFGNWCVIKGPFHNKNILLLAFSIVQ